MVKASSFRIREEEVVAGRHRVPTAIEGSLGPWAGELLAELDRLGYTPRTAATLMGLAERLSIWLEDRELDVAVLTADVVEDFVRAVRAGGGWFQPTTKSLVWLIDCLRAIGVAPTPPTAVPGSLLDEVVERYRRYLLDERGLTDQTIEGYERTARLFLAEHFGDGGRSMADVTAGQVTSFVTRACPTRRVGYAKLLVTGLRSFLRFAHLEGLIDKPLADAVPSAAGWTVAALPRGLAPGEAARLLASCDRSRANGRRDYAILVVFLRLGLRAAEVARLTLENLDWRAGEIVVRGKGGREERLPLPVDVGEAIVDYLRVRPRRPERSLFLRVHAPLRGLTPDGIAEVVRAGSERAGLGSFGSHRCRHTVATEILRAGAPLSEVAQVLRQRSHATTAIYAKVDHLALGELAMPWPGCAR
jgi:site-specific recombinase XerD